MKTAFRSETVNIISLGQFPLEDQHDRNPKSTQKPSR